MISTKTLIKLARKRQNFVAIKRRRVVYSNTNRGADVKSFRTSSTSRGHFVVYTIDQRRFAILLHFLNHEIVRELLKLAEEVFGLPSDGPLTLPCDASFMDYVIALIQHHITQDVQKALLVSIGGRRCSPYSSSYFHQESSQQPMICSF